MGIWYITREEVAGSADIKASAYMDSQIDAAIESGSRDVEGLLHRKFYPEVGVRYFDWPDYNAFSSFRLWLGESEVIEVTELTTAGVVIPSTSYYLEPVNQGPPYDHIELNRSLESWHGAGTEQRSIAVYGTFGYDLSELAAGTTSADINASTTTLPYSGSPYVGVGSVLRIESERLIVTGKGWTTTGQTTSIGANVGTVTLTVADGTAFTAGQLILIDGERMKVRDVAGNTVTVQRAVDGSVLAAHTSATIYAQKSLSVSRGALGTIAAAHTSGASIAVMNVPGLVKELALAYSLNNLSQRSSGYARVVGTGEGQRESGGRGIRSIEEDAIARYGRGMRMWAV